MRIRAELNDVFAYAARSRADLAALRSRVEAATFATAVEMRRIVVTRYLVGPRPQYLITGGPGNTGLLGRSINVRDDSTSRTVRASVGTNVWYGRLWEEGFDREVGWGTRGGKNRTPAYKAKHPRGTTHYAARPFLHPALDDVRDTFRERVRAAARGA